MDGCMHACIHEEAVPLIILSLLGQPLLTLYIYIR